MTQQEWTPKHAKNAFFVVLNSSTFPNEKKAKCVVSARKSRQQIGLKAYYKAENTIKIGVSTEIAKTKMTPFFGKRCFLTWLKKWVLLTVFLKSCVS